MVLAKGSSEQRMAALESIAQLMKKEWIPLSEKKRLFPTVKHNLWKGGEVRLFAQQSLLPFMKEGLIDSPHRRASVNHVLRALGANTSTPASLEALNSAIERNWVSRSQWRRVFYKAVVLSKNSLWLVSDYYENFLTLCVEQVEKEAGLGHSTARPIRLLTMALRAQAEVRGRAYTAELLRRLAMVGQVEEPVAQTPVQPRAPTMFDIPVSKPPYRLRAQPVLLKRLVEVYVALALTNLRRRRGLENKKPEDAEVPTDGAFRRWYNWLNSAGQFYDHGDSASGKGVGPLMMVLSQAGILNSSPRTPHEALLAWMTTEATFAEPTPELLAERSTGFHRGLADNKPLLSQTRGLYKRLLGQVLGPYHSIDAFEDHYPGAVRWEVLSLLIRDPLTWTSSANEVLDSKKGPPGFFSGLLFMGTFWTYVRGVFIGIIWVTNFVGVLGMFRADSLQTFNSMSTAFMLSATLLWLNGIRQWRQVRRHRWSWSLWTTPIVLGLSVVGVWIIIKPSELNLKLIHIQNVVVEIVLLMATTGISRHRDDDSHLPLARGA